MFFLILGAIVSTGISIVLYKNDFHLTVKDNFEKFKELNSFLSHTKHTGKCKALMSSCNVVMKTVWLNIVHKFMNNIEHIDKNTVAISYVLDGVLYKVVTRRRRGPPMVMMVLTSETTGGSDTDGDVIEVSSEIIPYMGPERNWHLRKFTPVFWGKENLTFEMTSGESRTFKRDEEIVLF